MTLEKLQHDIDLWIKSYGVRYFDVLTNTILLMEEVGEVSRLVARLYGEQSFKDDSPTVPHEIKLKEELGDVLFVLVCIANQLDINLEQVMKDNLDKKTERDADRHKNNPKLGL